MNTNVTSFCRWDSSNKSKNESEHLHFLVVKTADSYPSRCLGIWIISMRGQQISQIFNCGINKRQHISIYQQNR